MRWLSLTLLNICANDPAIKGGCVTRRKHRAESSFLVGKVSRCEESMAQFLPILVQVISPDFYAWRPPPAKRFIKEYERLIITLTVLVWLQKL